MYYPYDSVEQIKGVGEYVGKKLRSNNIKTVIDLLNYFPFRYEDLSQIKNVQDIEPNEQIVLKGEFKQITTFFTRTKKQITKAKFFDQTGEIETLWFNSKYIKSQLKTDQIYMVTCKPSLYSNKVNIVNPGIEESGKSSVKSGRIVPVYYNIHGVHMTKLKKMLLEVTTNTVITDFLNSNDHKILDLEQTYKEIHFPSSLTNAKQAQDRIAFNEIMHVKLHGEKVKSIQSKSNSKFTAKKDYSTEFTKKLPFTLTKDQVKANSQLFKLYSNSVPMNALVSGDVGSGKTIVAINASYNVYKNGGRVVYLAPTVVLANQIYKEYLNYFNDTEVILVTSSTSKKVGEQIDQGLFDPKIIIGTHAVLNIKNIQDFGDLIVVDEQHKFGVKQRAKLIEQTKTSLPHVLTMTATPIPRSLALTYFNEMKLIQIKTKPKGRKPVITKVLPESKRKSCYKWVKDEIKGRSCYYIVPFIEKSQSEEFSNVKSIEEVKDKLIKEFGKENVEILHGKYKEQEKKDIIDGFKSKPGGILLSTQVVEVGVDVPNATAIIIESAERFGLSSLHQLRGRVGRNDMQSYCFLFTSTKASLNSERLKAIEKETNGFKLAEIDLKQRGSGEVFGLRQSGEIDLMFVDFTNLDLIKKATKVASNVYSDSDKLKAYQENPFTRDFLNIKDN